MVCHANWGSNGVVPLVGQEVVGARPVRGRNRAHGRGVPRAETLVKTPAMNEHPRHVGDARDVPRGYVLVESMRAIEHLHHVPYL